MSHVNKKKTKNSHSKPNLKNTGLQCGDQKKDEKNAKTLGQDEDTKTGDGASENVTKTDHDVATTGHDVTKIDNDVTKTDQDRATGDDKLLKQSKMSPTSSFTKLSAIPSEARNIADGISPSKSQSRGLAVLPAIHESADEEDEVSSSSTSSMSGSPSSLRRHTPLLGRVSSKPNLMSISEEIIYAQRSTNGETAAASQTDGSSDERPRSSMDRRRCKQLPVWSSDSSKTKLVYHSFEDDFPSPRELVSSEDMREVVAEVTDLPEGENYYPLAAKAGKTSLLPIESKEEPTEAAEPRPSRPHRRSSMSRVGDVTGTSSTRESRSDHNVSSLSEDRQDRDKDKDIHKPRGRERESRRKKRDRDEREREPSRECLYSDSPSDSQRITGSQGLAVLGRMQSGGDSSILSVDPKATCRLQYDISFPGESNGAHNTREAESRGQGSLAEDLERIASNSRFGKRTSLHRQRHTNTSHDGNNDDSEESSLSNRKKCVLLQAGDTLYKVDDFSDMMTRNNLYNMIGEGIPLNASTNHPNVDDSPTNSIQDLKVNETSSDDTNNISQSNEDDLSLGHTNTTSAHNEDELSSGHTSHLDQDPNEPAKSASNTDSVKDLDAGDILSRELHTESPLSATVDGGGQYNIASLTKTKDSDRRQNQEAEDHTSFSIEGQSRFTSCDEFQGTDNEAMGLSAKTSTFETAHSDLNDEVTIDQLNALDHVDFLYHVNSVSHDTNVTDHVDAVPFSPVDPAQLFNDVMLNDVMLNFSGEEFNMNGFVSKIKDTTDTFEDTMCTETCPTEFLNNAELSFTEEGSALRQFNFEIPNELNEAQTAMVKQCDNDAPDTHETRMHEKSGENETRKHENPGENETRMDKTPGGNESKEDPTRVGQGEEACKPEERTEQPEVDTYPPEDSPHDPYPQSLDAVMTYITNPETGVVECESDAFRVKEHQDAPESESEKHKVKLSDSGCGEYIVATLTNDSGEYHVCDAGGRRIPVTSTSHHGDMPLTCSSQNEVVELGSAEGNLPVKEETPAAPQLQNNPTAQAVFPQDIENCHLSSCACSEKEAFEEAKQVEEEVKEGVDVGGTMQEMVDILSDHDADSNLSELHAVQTYSDTDNCQMADQEDACADTKELDGQEGEVILLNKEVTESTDVDKEVLDNTNTDKHESDKLTKKESSNTESKDQNNEGNDGKVPENTPTENGTLYCFNEREQLHRVDPLELDNLLKNVNAQDGNLIEKASVLLDQMKQGLVQVGLESSLTTVDVVKVHSVENAAICCTEPDHQHFHQHEMKSPNEQNGDQWQEFGFWKQDAGGACGFSDKAGVTSPYTVQVVEDHFGSSDPPKIDQMNMAAHDPGWPRNTMNGERITRENLTQSEEIRNVPAKKDADSSSVETSEQAEIFGGQHSGSNQDLLPNIHTIDNEKRDFGGARPKIRKPINVKFRENTSRSSSDEEIEKVERSILYTCQAPKHDEDSIFQDNDLDLQTTDLQEVIDQYASTDEYADYLKLNDDFEGAGAVGPSLLDGLQCTDLDGPSPTFEALVNIDMPARRSDDDDDNGYNDDDDDEDADNYIEEGLEAPNLPRSFTNLRPTKCSPPAGTFARKIPIVDIADFPKDHPCVYYPDRHDADMRANYPRVYDPDRGPYPDGYPKHASLDSKASLSDERKKKGMWKKLKRSFSLKDGGRLKRDGRIVFGKNEATFPEHKAERELVVLDRPQRPSVEWPSPRPQGPSPRPPRLRGKTAAKRSRSYRNPQRLSLLKQGAEVINGPLAPIRKQSTGSRDNLMRSTSSVTPSMMSSMATSAVPSVTERPQRPAEKQVEKTGRLKVLPNTHGEMIEYCIDDTDKDTSPSARERTLAGPVPCPMRTPRNSPRHAIDDPFTANIHGIDQLGKAKKEGKWGCSVM